MKRKAIIIFLAAAVLFTACSGKEKNTDTGGTAGEASSETAEIIEAPFKEEEIEQSEADKILKEKLKGLDCNVIFSKFTRLDEVDCYLYSVVNKDEEKSDQMLAVNAVSGEVMVYDPDSDSLQSFDRFEYYEDDGSSPANWDASYYLSPRTVTLMPADDNSFEFSVKKDDVKEPELEGIARVSSNNLKEAVYEKDKVSLTFVNKGDTLEIKDNGNKSGFAGIYTMVQ